MKFVHHLVISYVSTGLFACKVVFGLEDVVEISSEILLTEGLRLQLSSLKFPNHRGSN